MFTMLHFSKLTGGFTKAKSFSKPRQVVVCWQTNQCQADCESPDRGPLTQLEPTQTGAPWYIHRGSRQYYQRQSTLS